MRTYQGRLLEREDIWPKVWKMTRILLNKKVEEGTFDLKGCNIFDMVKARQVEWPKQRMMTGGSKIYWKVKFLMPEERNIILTLLKDNSFPCYQLRNAIFYLSENTLFLEKKYFTQNVYLKLSFRIVAVSGHMPSSGIAGSCGRFVPRFLRNLHSVLHNDCISLHFYPQYKTVPFSPYSL